MEQLMSPEQLAAAVNTWCLRHAVEPASGQAGERVTERTLRYYRTLGLLDPPLAGAGKGFGEKHRLQLVAIRLLQAQGLPLNRIRELLFGRSLEELKHIERQGLTELREAPIAAFQRPSKTELWGVSPLDDEFVLISRRGRTLPVERCEQLLSVLRQNGRNYRRHSGTTKRN